MKRHLLTFALIVATFSIFGQDKIHLNQLGFLPEAQKIAVCVDTDATKFDLIKASNNTVAYSGELTSKVYWDKSKEYVRIADFSDFKTRGTYKIKLSSGDLSYAFTIGDEVFTELTKASIKAFYFNRASTALTEEFAGVYQRPMGHPDDHVIVLPSAASTNRPAGTVISTPKGWYDAGDYNKYIVNSGISVFTLLSAYENYSGFYDSLYTNIPESTNSIPDLLDEALWNIEWMATMQDEDGGVYNKTTHANFQGFVMPDKATAPRYVVAKGTAATLDFAAVMAMASRIYKSYLPDFANQCLTQSKLAWQWAQDHKNVPFNNPGAEGGYPSVSTGGYGDTNFADEFFWAAAELYITTGNDDYYNTLDFSQSFGVPGWPNVQTLGLLSLITHRKSLTPAADTTSFKKKLLGITEGVMNYQKNSSPYQIPNNGFYWGSNSNASNQGMLLMHTYKLTGDIDYYNASLAALDYLVGRNATGYCFVTDQGSKSPMNIHHRQSGADNIAEPVPGFISGGPNPQNTDDCGSNSYPTLTPAKCFLDNECSYSTNEIAINWNAPLVYLSGAIEATYLSAFYIPDTSSHILSLKQVNDFSIYPNPATEFIEIKASSPIIDVQIFALDGKKILRSTECKIDVSDLKSGVYLVSTVTKSGRHQQRLVIH